MGFDADRSLEKRRRDKLGPGWHGAEFSQYPQRSPARHLVSHAVLQCGGRSLESLLRWIRAKRNLSRAGFSGLFVRQRVRWSGRSLHGRRRLIFSYTDSNKHPWEGDQGADSFYVYQSGGKWRGFLGSAGTSYHWCVGLASSARLAGPWKRAAGSSPAISFAENPIVTTLADGATFCVFDDLAHGISNCHSIGYGYSRDGAHWSTNYLFIPMPGWAVNIRTPQCLIPAGNDEYWVYFTANTPSGFDCVGRMKLRLKISR